MFPAGYKLTLYPFNDQIFPPFGHSKDQMCHDDDITALINYSSGRSRGNLLVFQSTSQEYCQKVNPMHYSPPGALNIFLGICLGSSPKSHPALSFQPTSLSFWILKQLAYIGWKHKLRIKVVLGWVWRKPHQTDFGIDVIIASLLSIIDT